MIRGFELIEAVSFDCDGICLDSDQLQVDAEKQTAQTFAEELGVELDIEALDWSLFKGWARTKIAAELFGVEKDLAEKFRETVADTSVTIASYENLRLIEGIKDFAGYLALHGCRVGLATSSDRRIYDAYAGLFDLGFVETTVARREAVDDKPAPGPHMEVIKRLGTTRDHAVVIEDSPSGILSGLRTGGLVIAHATTQSAPSLRQETEAHVVVESYKEAAYLLQPLLPDFARV